MTLMTLDATDEKYYYKECNNCNGLLLEEIDEAECPHCGINLKECGLEPNFAQFDQDGFDIERECMADLIEEIKKPPYRLIAEGSNWLGQTGEATANSGEEVLEKIFSFGGDWIDLRRERNSLFCRTATHDVPTGFNIKILRK